MLLQQMCLYAAEKCWNDTTKIEICSRLVSSLKGKHSVLSLFVLYAWVLLKWQWMFGPNPMHEVHTIEVLQSPLNILVAFFLLVILLLVFCMLSYRKNGDPETLVETLKSLYYNGYALAGILFCSLTSAHLYHFAWNFIHLPKISPPLSVFSEWCICIVFVDICRFCTWSVNTF